MSKIDKFNHENRAFAGCSDWINCNRFRAVKFQSSEKPIKSWVKKSYYLRINYKLC
nr:MAG TPA: hypothetical protein [Caudoviricetes sp.]